jgi:hypothetical protein
MTGVRLKRCCKCWRYLPITDFNYDASTSDRLTYRCSPCIEVHAFFDTFTPSHPTDSDAIHS